MEKLIGDKADLRYLEANNVRCSLGNLADFQVCTSDSKSLGNIEGVLISPSTRRCEYFVIESSNPKVSGWDGAVRSYVDYLDELAVI